MKNEKTQSHHGILMPRSILVFPAGSAVDPKAYAMGAVVLRGRVRESDVPFLPPSAWRQCAGLRESSQIIQQLSNSLIVGIALESIS